MPNPPEVNKMVELDNKVTQNPKIKILDRLSKIIKEFELESNIPLNHEYWVLKNQLLELER